MSAERAVLVVCNYCGVQQIVTQRETVVAPNIHSARLYLSMQGWSKKGNADICYRTDCRDIGTTSGE